MYQFTTTNVINSAYAVDLNGLPLLDSNGASVAKIVGSTTSLDVRKVGTFLTSKIVSIDKRPYTVGVKEIFTVTVPAITSGLVARLDVVLKLRGTSTQSEYTNYSLDFLKPITVEVVATNSAAADAAALIVQFNSLKNRFGRSYATAVLANTADIVITVNEDVLGFQSVLVSKQVLSPNSIIQPEYELVATGTVATAGKIGFGDDLWMIRTAMIPTAENVRYFGISKEERPIMGGNYTQYSLRYSIDKDGQDGILSGGKSVTTHVFYVKSDLVTTFEAAIIATGISINTVGVLATDVAITNNLDLSEYATSGYTTVYTTTPAGLTGGVWSRYTTNDLDAASSDADFTKVTISKAGVVSLAAGHALAANDHIGVQVVIDGVTITKYITVQA